MPLEQDVGMQLQNSRKRREEAVMTRRLVVKMLLQAKSGKKKGYLIEGMGCPGGCVAGAGTNIPVVKAQIQVKKFVEEAEDFVPPETAQY